MSAENKVAQPDQASVDRADTSAVLHKSGSDDVHSITKEAETGSEDTSSVETKEFYRQAWSKKLLIVAYSILFFVAFVETFAGDSTSSLDSYATSNFDAHALIATAAVVYKITAIVTYPILAKISDFFGRAEGFGFSVLIYSMSYVLYAACRNVQSYVCAEILYAIGKVGYRVFQQIFIADTTSLINRGLWAQLPDAIAAIPALYAGSYIQDAVLEHSTWRWGYGYWAIVLSISCIPLIYVMWILDVRTKSTHTTKLYRIMENVPQDAPWWKKAYIILFRNLDMYGFILMVSGLALFFVPLSMTGTSSPYKWKEGKLIAMLVIGFVLFCCFLLWNLRFAKRPFVPRQTFANRTMALTCIMVALDLLENSSFATYFKTVMQVSAYTTAGEATRIDSSKKVNIQIFSIVAGLVMKYTKRTKIFVFIGVPMLVLGHGLLVYFVNTNSDKVASKPLLYMAEVFIGAGRGIYQTALQVSVQAIAGSEGIPMSTAFFLMFQSVGSLIGSCVAGGIWNTIVLRKLKKYLPDENKANATKIYKSISVALKYKKGTETRDAIAKAYRETVQIIGWVGLGVIAPMLIMMFFVQDVKLTKHNDIYHDDSEEEGVVVDKTVAGEAERKSVDSKVADEKARA